MSAEGEVAVLGLARSGRAVAELLLKNGRRVYASDAGKGERIVRHAQEIESLGGATQTGGHDLDRIRGAALVVLSPGIPPDAAAVRAAREGGARVVSEIEVALGFLSGSRVIAVTGTNGKTTTTALIAHILHSLGRKALPAGNIGMPLSAVALREQPPEWIALEMSSFQLHDTPGIRPRVGVLTNLSPDHLDRYATVEDYYADKALLFANATADSLWVVNGDDPAALELSRGARGRRLLFSLKSPADAWYDPETRTLKVLGEPLASRGELPLVGDHNVANALAAALAVRVADESFASAESREKISGAIGRFRALSHRLETVAETDGVRWINDSKATNVTSTKVALEGMDRPTILLLGGRHKGEPYGALASAIRSHVKLVIAYGEAAPLIEGDLSDVVTVRRMGSDFGEVVGAARAAARPGDTVLLSPACASYDMFQSYEERGDSFRQLARDTAGSGERDAIR